MDQQPDRIERRLNIYFVMSVLRSDDQCGRLRNRALSTSQCLSDGSGADVALRHTRLAL
jgi:hypothetical protein